MRRLAAIFAVLVLSVAVTPVASAQLGPNVPAPLTAPDPPPPPAENEAFDEGGLTMLQKVLIFGSAILVLGTIGWFIVRDAHRSAPVEERSQSKGPAAKVPARERERQQRQKRARDKAARAQRKRNRSR